MIHRRSTARLSHETEGCTDTDGLSLGDDEGAPDTDGLSDGACDGSVAIQLRTVSVVSTNSLLQGVSPGLVAIGTGVLWHQGLPLDVFARRRIVEVVERYDTRAAVHSSESYLDMRAR